MDEILIGEKKYVSSKRAAKMTGYAKDYIGQLCREGRVPARLVGRSWYVLETAIQDHRFGEQKTEQEKEEAAPAQILPPTWEAPRYEASPIEVLPSVNRLKSDEKWPSDGAQEDTKDTSGGAEAFSERLQDSWRAWFDRVEAQITPATPPTASEESKEESPEPEKVEREEETEEEGDVNIPIHAVYEPPPKELLPSRGGLAAKTDSNQEGKRVPNRRIGRLFGAIQLIGALFAVFSVASAAISTGYFDWYLVSVKQVQIISGVVIYNK